MTGFRADPDRANGPTQALLLGLLIFLVFGLAFWAPFIYDDVAFIPGNTDVVGFWQGWHHFLFKPNYFQEGYEPISLLIHRGLFLIGGAAPTLFRLSNILLHWLICVLVLRLFQELLGPGGPSFWLAALFAIFPSHTENIAIATFKKHILVALFGLLMLLVEHPWRREKPDWRRRSACAAFLAFGLFSKENAAVLPAILAAVSLCVAPDWKARLRRDRWFFAGLFAMDLGFLYWRTGVVPRSGGALVGASLSTHLLTAAKCLVWYLREFLEPIRLCQEHSVAPLPLAWSWTLAAVLGTLAAGAAFAVWVWRRDRVAFAGLAIAALWILPFLNIIPYLNVSLVANRYIYLSIAGLLLCAGRLSRPLWKLKISGIPAVPLACAFLGLFYAAVGMKNLSRYSDPVEVWEQAVCCAPNNPRALLSLGGLYASRQRYVEAEQELRAAARLNSGLYSVYAANNLGLLWAQTHRSDQAVFLFTALGRAKYSAFLQFSALGAALLQLDRVDLAIHAFRQALYANPRDAYSRSSLAFCYAKKGKMKLAEMEWKAASFDPNVGSMSLNNLAAVYMNHKRLPEAKKALEQSLQYNPLQIDAASRLAEIDAKLGHSQQGLALLDDIIARLGKGQRAALADAAGLSPQQLNIVVESVETALKQRALFVAKYPKSTADVGPK